MYSALRCVITSERTTTGVWSHGELCSIRRKKVFRTSATARYACPSPTSLRSVRSRTTPGVVLGGVHSLNNRAHRSCAACNPVASLMRNVCMPPPRVVSIGALVSSIMELELFEYIPRGVLWIQHPLTGDVLLFDRCGAPQGAAPTAWCAGGSPRSVYTSFPSFPAVTTCPYGNRYTQSSFNATRSTDVGWDVYRTSRTGSLSHHPAVFTFRTRKGRETWRQA